MDSPHIKQNMSRAAAEINAYKRARVFLVYTHGELAHRMPPADIPAKTMAIQTGEICKVVLTKIDDPIAKQFSTDLSRTIDLIGGEEPSDSEQPLFAQLAISLAGERIYQKRHWYIPGQDSFIMGIYEPLGGQLRPPPEAGIQQLQRSLQGTGLYTGDLLTQLRKAVSAERIIVVFVSCSVVRGTGATLNPNAARLAMSTGAAAQRFTQPSSWESMGLRQRPSAARASLLSAGAGGGAAAAAAKAPGWGRMAANQREMFAPSAFGTNTNNGEYVGAAPQGFVTESNVDQILESRAAPVQSYWDLALFRGTSFAGTYNLITAEGMPKPAQFPSALALYLFTKQDPSFPKTQEVAAGQGKQIKARQVTIGQDAIPARMGGGRQITSEKVYTLDEVEQLIPVGTKLLAMLPCGLGQLCLPKYEHLGGKRRRAKRKTRKMRK